MRLRMTVVLLALIFTACRTTRPAGERPLTSLTGPAARELPKLRDEFQGERSVVRIRTMNGVQTQSARAQLQVGRDGDMLLTAYAPVLNTPAARLYVANGRVVFLNDLEKTAWQGSASELTGTFGFVGANPAALGFLLVGLPPRDGASVTYADAGLQSARLEDAVIAYDPAVYPPQRIVVVRGAHRVEIDHLEDYASAAPIEPLKVPSDYRCCVLPKI